MPDQVPDNHPVWLLAVDNNRWGLDVAQCASHRLPAVGSVAAYWGGSHNICSNCVRDYAGHLHGGSWEQCSTCDRHVLAYDYDRPAPRYWPEGLPSVCGECRDTHYQRCSECERFHRNDQPQCCERPPCCEACGTTRRIRSMSRRVRSHGEPSIIEGVLCSYCESQRYVQCRECDYLTPVDETRCLWNSDDAVCETCGEESSNYVTCGTHGGLFEEHSLDDDDEDLPCCQASTRRSAEGLINYYSYRPAPVFHGIGKLFYGMEIEVNTTNTSRSALVATNGFGDLAYLKDDSSIGTGFELVTHPMSHTWMAEHFPFATLADLAASGAYASDRCGIHIHASREGFSSAAHEIRWMSWWDRNEEEVSVLARRGKSTWAKFQEKTVKDKKFLAMRGRPKAVSMACGTCYACRYREPERCETVRNSMGITSRYQAVNPTNTHTYEVRVFASSLDAQQVRAAFDLVDATIEYTRQLRVREITRNNGWAWSAFAFWISDRTQYSALNAEIKRLFTTTEV